MWKKVVLCDPSRTDKKWNVNNPTLLGRMIWVDGVSILGNDKGRMLGLYSNKLGKTPMTFHPGELA